MCMADTRMWKIRACPAARPVTRLYHPPMPHLLIWPVILTETVTAHLPELWWLLRYGWLLQTLGVTLLGGLIGRQLRPAVRHSPWLVLAITLGVCTAERLIPDGEVNRLIDRCYVTLLVVALWPERPGQRFRRAMETSRKTVQRWSTGVPLQG